MARIKNGSTYLDDHLTSNDYYAEGEQVVGQWQGLLASRLGITPGQSIHRGDEMFRSLRENINPVTKTKLTQRKVKDAIRFYDFQCSAQKSVSILHALTGDERLAAAHDRASAKAYAELESFASCRVRAGDAAWSQESRLSGNLCAAVFRHDASRALDPQLHTHFVVANATWDEAQQRMVALENREMYRAIRYVSKVYQNEMACAVKALGYVLEESRSEKGVLEGFEIRGVSRELCERFGKRRAEVEAGIQAFTEEKGRKPSRQEINVITRQTRSAKMAEISTPEVRAMQLAQLSEAEHQELLSVVANARERRRLLAHDASRDISDGSSSREQEALQAAVAHLFERSSVLHGHAVLAEALATHLGDVDLGRLKEEIQAGSADLVALETAEAGQTLSQRFTTRQGLALEKYCINLVNRTKDRCHPLLPDGLTMAEWLSDEQKEAVRFIGGSHDRIMAIHGVAGAGKTTLLKELDGQLAQAGQQLLYLAPTTGAVKVLQSEGFDKAITIAGYLTRAQTGKVPADWQNAVVVVDEAGLASNRQGAELLALAEQYNQRIVFVGDTRQHSSVEAGSFLRILEDHSQIAVCELKDVRRQTHAEYNRAVRLMSSGHVAAGMEQLDALGWIQEEQGDYLEAAAKAYLGLGAAAKRSEEVLCVAPTWAEVHRVTAHIRAGLHAAGQLGETRKFSVLDPLGWTIQQRRTTANYRRGMVITFNRQTSGFAAGQSCEVERVEEGIVTLAGGKRLDLKQAPSYDVSRWLEIELAIGDRILLRANRKKAKLHNGQVLTVGGFGPDGTITTVEGQTIPADYRHFTHGYVVTSHKGQGRTSEHVVVAAAHLARDAAYVACTRAKRSCLVFTPDKENLFAGLPHSADRQAALDVLREKEVQRRNKIAREARSVRADALEQVVLVDPVAEAGEESPVPAPRPSHSKRGGRFR